MPSDLDSEPRRESIRALHDHIQTDAGWIAQRKLDTWMREHYFEEQFVLGDDTANEKRNRRIDPEPLPTGEAARIVDLIASFFPEPPIMGAHYTGINDKTPTAGEDVAIAINEAINQLNPLTDSPWRTGVFNKVLYGRSADLVVKGHDYWSSFPYKGDGEGEKDWDKREAEWRKLAPLPLAWQSLPPESTFPASLSTINDEALCTKTVSWSDIKDMFDDKELKGVKIPNTSSKEWYKPVMLGIYSNRHSIAYMIIAAEKTGKTVGIGGEFDDKIVRTIEHGLGRSAIRILPGLTSGRKEPPYYWRSVLYPIMGLLETIDRLGSRALTSSKFSAYPWMKAHINEGAIDVDGDGSKAEKKDNFEGDISFLNAGNGASGEGREDINPVFQPEHGEETRELFIWALDRSGQITGANPILEGQLTANTAAWAHNYAGENGKRKLAPLTANIIGGAIDISESISLSVQSFDEKIPLAKPAGAGKILLDPKAMHDYQYAIQGTYDAAVPINWRADLDTMMSVLERTKELGYGPGPIWTMKRLGNIEDPWHQHKELMEFLIVADEETRQARLKMFRNRLEAELAESEGMGLEELANTDLPPDIQQALTQAIQQTPPGAQTNGNQSRVSPETAGLQRAESTFSTGQTGPTPGEVIP